jgi:hypothetical protein
MPRNRGRATTLAVYPDSVFSSIACECAAMLAEVPFKIPTLPTAIVLKNALIRRTSASARSGGNFKIANLPSRSGSGNSIVRCRSTVGSAEAEDVSATVETSRSDCGSCSRKLEKSRIKSDYTRHASAARGSDRQPVTALLAISIVLIAASARAFKKTAS